MMLPIIFMCAPQVLWNILMERFQKWIHQQINMQTKKLIWQILEAHHPCHNPKGMVFMYAVILYSLACNAFDVMDNHNFVTALTS